MAVPSATPTRRLAHVPARVGGLVLAGIFGATAVVRRSKPLHPRGALLSAAVRRKGSPEPVGVPWIDGVGVDAALVRLSRATGVPAPAPDIFGLAMRFGRQDDPVDLLFASTGLGRVTRFVLTARRTIDAGPLTTLLPLSTPAGPLLLAAVPLSTGRTLPADPAALAGALELDPLLVELRHAGLRGPWHTFGLLEIGGPVDLEVDPLVRFAPVRNTLAGTQQYPWVRALREPAYARARASWPRPADEASVSPRGS